jgi:hypothetical protein
VEDLKQSKIKVCDFGTLPLIIIYSLLGIATILRPQDTSDAISFSTPAYEAPENSSNLSPKVDVYSFALILWQLCTREHLWKDTKSPWEIVEKVRAGKRPTIPDTIPTSIKELIVDCWAPNPVDRPTFKRIHEKLELFQNNGGVTTPPQGISKSVEQISGFEKKSTDFFGEQVIQIKSYC